MKILIETIPHDQQRYETVGDWWYDAYGTLQIRVSKMGCRESELDVAIHEMIEAEACRKAGITEQSVTQFDLQYEKERQAGLHKLLEEPGDDDRAPYKTQHEAAEFVERAACSSQDMSWQQHCINVNEATK
jgi:hypothetical protein